MGISAEESLAALARDLLEEISAGRAVELAEAMLADPEADPVELARFNVRPFQRVETVHGRRVVENVGAHTAERGGAGLAHPGDLRGYIPPEKWLEGQKEWAAKGEAIWAAHRWHDVHPDSSRQVSQHLAQAHRHLAPESGHPNYSRGYQELHAAHQAAVEGLLPRAQTDEQRAGIREGLQHIQHRMEDINEQTGTDKAVTRRLTGNVHERAKHAAAKLEQPRHPQVAPPPAQQLPPPPTGAGAVHPHLGGHLPRVPGETISQGAYSHVPRPLPAEAPSAEAQALEQANKRIQGYADREARQREQDLRQHVSAIRARELEARGIAAPGTYQPLSDEQFAHHVSQLEETIAEALRQGKATNHQFALDEHGTVWDPDRAMQHADIIKDFMDKQVDVPSQRRAIMLGGPPGAGKSTLLSQYEGIRPGDFAVVNTDHFKEELAKRGMVPEVAGLSPMEASALVHEESAYLHDLAAAELQRRGKNLVFDGTMRDHRTTSDRVDQLKRHGYNVGAMFIDVPVERSLQGVESRYRRGLEEYRAGRNPLGGRHVPRSVVLSGESRPGRTHARDTFDALKPEFTWWERHDGETGQLAEQSTAQQQSGGAIPSVEELRRQMSGGTYTGATEAEAQAREHGTNI